MKQHLFLQRGVFVLATLSALLFAACYKDSNSNASVLIPQTLYTVTNSAKSIPADGYSKVNITVQGLPVNTDDTGNSVIFTTDYGLFISNSTNSATVPWTYVANPAENDSLERTATAILKGTIIPDTAYVTATLNSVTVADTLYFVAAYPNQLFIQPSSAVINTSDTTGISVVVSLVRYYGTPSLYTPVTLTVNTSSTNNVVAFSQYQNLSDSTGKCYFQFTFLDATYNGNLTVTATAPGSPPVSESITLAVSH